MAYGVVRHADEKGTWYAVVDLDDPNRKRVLHTRDRDKAHRKAKSLNKETAHVGLH